MKIEIWFEFASTYSYLTVARAEERLQNTNIQYEWKPFLLGPIFREKGLETSPFVLDPIKGAYMWRDIERRSKRYGLDFVRPSVFPMHSLLAARVMVACLAEPWCGRFAKDVFNAHFAHGKDISDKRVIRQALQKCGTNPDHWLSLALSEPVKLALRELTETAKSKGIFGAPSFVVGQELFWGDDRFEDAIEWAVSHAEF